MLGRILMMAAALVTQSAAAQDVTVFAAASLQNAFEDVNRLYQQKTGKSVRFSFAASSALARQIEQGAPAAIFASADEQWMNHLQERRLIVDATRKSLLGNRLVLVVPAGSNVSVELKPGFDISSLLGADGRWVTADPSSVPAGRYAKEALSKLGVWDFARTRLVSAENVRVALAFVERGEVNAGVVYETDAAVSQKVRVAGIFPADSYTPVTYPVAIVSKNDTPAARDFIAFLESPEARATYRKYGFSVL